MNKRTKVEMDPRGFPAAWWPKMLAQGKPSQQAYDNAIAYIESHPVTKPAEPPQVTEKIGEAA